MKNLRGSHVQGWFGGLLISGLLAAAVLLSVSGCAGLVGSSGGGSAGGNGSPAISVSAPGATAVTAASALISWTSNVPGDSQVDYGTTTAYGSSSSLDSTLLTSHSATLTGLSASTTYHYRVKSRDSAGSLATSSDATLTTTAAADTTAPAVSITAPANNAIVSGTVTASANASDNVGVASVQFQLDGANLGSLDTTSPYSVSWTTTTAGNGSHTLRAIARDAAGNSTTSANVTVTVSNSTPDTTPPTVTISAPANNATVSGAVTVSANASDNAGVASVQFLLDGGNLGSLDAASPYSVSWNTTTASNGSHTLQAIAKDAAGNSTTSAAATVTVNNASADTTPPSVPTALAATAQSSSQIHLTWSASTDNVGVTGYRIYRGGAQVGTSFSTSYTDNGLTPGTPYSYTVAAYDAAGNASVQSASASATTPASTGRVIEIFPSNANASCNEEFENVANTLGAGDTLILHGGTYTQGCRRYISGLRGTAANPITIEAASGEIPIVTRPDDSENNIEFDGSSYLTIRGLQFLGGDSGVRLMVVDHLTFEDNEIYGTSNNALRANDSNTDSLTIRHNHMHDTGLYTAGPTEGEGMYLGCNNNACHMTNSLIVGNYIHHLRSTSSGGNDGIEIKVGSGGNMIRDNVIHDTNIGVAYPCITAFGGGPAVNTIEGNVAWNCGEGMYVVSDAIVRNNIIFNSDPGISSYPHAQISQMKNLTFVNNTIYNSGDCLYLRWSGATNLVVANNALYCSGGNALNASGIGSATIRKNFVEGGMSGGSVDGVAFVNGGTFAGAFVNAAGWNFWPTASSPLRGAADVNYVPALDFNGTARTNPFDAGAYEVEAFTANPGWQIVAGFKPMIIP